MAEIPVRELGAGLVGRAIEPPGPERGDPVVLLHGFPESSLMWEPLMLALAAEGRRCLAPDLYGLGDSRTEQGTFEGSLVELERFLEEAGRERVALVVHDWGGFVGLAWACDHPDRVSALVISSTGFFSDGRWHGVAEAIRGPEGEGIVGALDREGFGALLNGDGELFDQPTIDAYWRPFEEGHGRRATLDFYRSLDFAKLSRWDGRLAGVGARTLILWGGEDPFASVAGAKRFHREIPDSELVVLEGAGHFVFDEQRERTTREVVSFLTR
jgi:haloalkane dehalogenase